MNWPRVKEIVADALEASPEERAAVINSQCNGDPELRDEVVAMVEAHETADGVIHPRTDAWLGLGGTDLLSLGGQKIGRYRLERLLAEGAMAAVYIAQQSSPHRRVALKLLRTSLPVLDAAQRFKRESAALGRLRHPNIAQIYESGVHRVGSQLATPYLAMEYIDGKPLNQFARDEKLTRDQRIGLIIKVARAVHAAHQQAIIHRDLKPANILVDTTGEPKVLDFGIARIVGVEDEHTTWQTTAGVLLGTPGYMSPEQASGDPQTVDVRSDVWSIGVLLHELLTERLPVNVRNLSIVDVLKRIETTEPPPIGKIDPSLRGDLETIVSTALTREKKDRYSSAEALADDLERFLEHQPILARAPSTLYRLRKFARRHRFGFAIGTGFLILLIAATITASIGFVRAARQRDRAERINNFLLEMMSTTDPNVGDKDMTVAQALASSDKFIAKHFAADPGSEAEVRSTIGWTFYQLGKYDQAVAQLQRAVELRKITNGPAGVETIDDTARLITAIRWQYKPLEALAIAEPVYKLACESLGEEHPSTLSILDNLAGALDDAGRYTEAEPLYRKAVELNTKVSGPEDDQTLTAMNNLSVVLINLGRHAEAEPLLREVIAVRSRGDRGHRVAAITNRHNLASVLANLGRYHEAIEEFERTIADSTQLLGEDHSRTLSARVSYADALAQIGRAADALAINRDVLECRKRLLGPAHEQTLTSMHNVLNSMLACKQFTEVEPLARAFMQDADAHSPANHPLRIVARQDLAAALAGQKKFSEAEPIQREVIARWTQKTGPTNSRVLAQQNNLAMMLMESGRPAEALEVFGTIAHALAAAPSPLIAPAFHRNRGRTLLALQRFEQAEKDLIQAYQITHAAGNEAAARENAGYLLELYTAWNKPQDASKWRAVTTAATQPAQ